MKFDDKEKLNCSKCGGGLEHEKTNIVGNAFHSLYKCTKCLFKFIFEIAVYVVSPKGNDDDPGNQTI